MKPWHLLTRQIRAGLACILLLLAPRLAWATPPVFHIDASGKSGAEIGEILGSAIKRRFPDVEKRYDAYLQTFITQELFDQWVEERVKVILPNIDQRYRDEVEGISSRWQIYSRDKLGDGYLSLNEYWLLQLSPDVGRQTSCSGFGVWGTASESSSPIVGRNMDWYTNEALRSLQAITVYQYENSGIANIGFAGYIGVISGFNHDGLFVAHLDSPLLQQYPDPSRDHAIVFDMRKALETNSRIATTAKQLARERYGFSHSILMADKTNVAVLEQPQGHPALLRTDKSVYRLDKPWDKREQIAVVNCYVLASSPSNCWNSHDSLRWQRFRTLAQFNASDNPAEVTGVIDIMFDTAQPPQQIFNKKTVQSMVFTPANQKLYLYTTPLSGVHGTDPHMQEISNLIPSIEQGASWITPLNLLIFLAAFALGGVLVYGEISKRDTSPD